jgi:hypothetical protein
MQEGKRQAQLPFRLFNPNDQPNFLGAWAVVALWTTTILDTLHLVRIDS